jgi:hypothetical protein
MTCLIYEKIMDNFMYEAIENTDLEIQIYTFTHQCWTLPGGYTTHGFTVPYTIE